MCGILNLFIDLQMGGEIRYGLRCYQFYYAGYIKDGHLFLTERIKDLFKTSNGKYIAPQAIEAKLVVDRYICLLYTSRCV